MFTEKERRPLLRYVMKLRPHGWGSGWRRWIWKHQGLHRSLAWSILWMGGGRLRHLCSLLSSLFSPVEHACFWLTQGGEHGDLTPCLGCLYRESGPLCTVWGSLSWENNGWRHRTSLPWLAFLTTRLLSQVEWDTWLVFAMESGGWRGTTSKLLSTLSFPRQLPIL